MNATGDGYMANYNNSIRSKQTGKLSASMNYLDQVLVRSALGHMPDDYTYVWNPLEQMNDLEAAQSEQLRSQKDQTYLDLNIVTVSQVQRRLQSNNEYQFNDEQIEALEDLEDSNMFDKPITEPLEIEQTDANFKKRFR